MNPQDGVTWSALLCLPGQKAEYGYFGVGGGPPGLPNLFTHMLLPILGKVGSKSLTYEVTYDGSTQQVTDTWDYSISPSGTTTITGPDGGISTQKFYSTDTDNNFSGRVYKEIDPSGTITERIWANNKVGGCPTYVFGCGSTRRLNTYVKTEFTTIPDSAGNPYLTAIKDFEYDKNGNVTKLTEYDWVPYSSIPHAQTGPPVVTGLPSGLTVLRTTENTLYNQTETASNSTANNPASYWNESAPNVRSAVSSTSIKDGNGTIKSRSELYYFDVNTIANLIETRVWDSTNGVVSDPLTTGVSGNAIASSLTYNQYGMPLTATDANGIVTKITYGNVTGPNGVVTDLYPTQTITAFGTSVARTSSAVYDFYTGLVTTATDVDNNVSVVTEYDDLGRPTKVRSAAGAALESWTQSQYDNVARRVIVRSDLETVGDGKKVAIQHYDQLGRVRLSRTLENPWEDPTDETHGIKIETRYQTGNPNSYHLNSNPFRAPTSTAATNEPTMGWTRSKSWNHGRRSETETFSGSALPAPWGSNSTSTGVVVTESDANTATVTDQTSKKRRTVNNSLGQLVRVDEPNDAGQLDVGGSPFQSTNYSYDPLNNLKTVAQGSQTRTFVYSSLSRMTSEANPESGTTTYEFDNNGNPTKKTDSRGVSTSFAYDALNRVTQKNYTGESGYTTPTITYTYDDAPNGIGRLTKVSSSISENRYLAFDKNGRIFQSQQITDGQTYAFEYAHNLSGMLVEQTYPSGRKMKNVFVGDGDLSMVQSRKTANSGYQNYAKHFTYNPVGAVTSLQLGNGQWQSSQFNSKLQMTQTALGSTQSATNLLKLEFNYGSTQNNGTLQSQTITVPTVGADPGFVATQSYTYDTLSRLKLATEVISSTETWKQTFTFDRFGNRNFDEVNSTTLPKNCGTSPNLTVCSAERKIVNPSVNSATNRLNTSEDYAYDNTGNTTGDPEGRVFKYDGENKQYEVRDSLTQIIGQYSFDGGGKRIKKLVPSTGETTVFVYDANGKLSAEYSTTLSQTPQTSFITGDHLGSPRIKTDQNGVVISRNDYLPFGEDISTAQRTQALGYKPDDVRQKFTGYERDDETGLDFAQARMYSNGLGRFSTTDPSRKSVQTINPQTWHRYAYCYNNPIAYTDPNGKWPPGTHDRILARALNTMEKSFVKATQDGSRKVDRNGLDVKTMYEKNAHEHAMTPGSRVKEIGLDAAKKEARNNAIGFIEGNLEQAKSKYQSSMNATNPWFDKKKGISVSLEFFGAAMHPVMDNGSPAHRSFQVYDNVTTAAAGASVGYATGGITGAVVGAGGSLVASQVEHANIESREPTQDEMNTVVDEIRYRFQQTYGQEAYELAVSEEERKATAERMTKRGTEGMLVR